MHQGEGAGVPDPDSADQVDEQTSVGGDEEHHLLRVEHDNDWAWRRAIRRRRSTLVAYRAVVLTLGAVLVIGGLMMVPLRTRMAGRAPRSGGPRVGIRAGPTSSRLRQGEAAGLGGLDPREAMVGSVLRGGADGAVCGGRRLGDVAHQRCPAMAPRLCRGPAGRPWTVAATEAMTPARAGFPRWARQQVSSRVPTQGATDV